MYLEVNHLCKKIQQNEILRDVNLKMERKKIYGFMGINGSGKTMLMRCICGLVRPTSGEVLIDGKKLGIEMDFPKSLGALIENPGFIEHYNAYDNLIELASIKKVVGSDEVKKLLNEVGLDYDNKKRVKKYSLGMRQKLGIAIAFLEHSDMLVLDEPFNALDQMSVDKVKKMILERKEQGALVLISCHNKEDLELLSDEIYQIENGYIIEHYCLEHRMEEKPLYEEKKD